MRDSMHGAFTHCAPSRSPCRKRTGTPQSDVAGTSPASAVTLPADARAGAGGVVTVAGSSPRGRGAPASIVVGERRLRFIPARAGNTAQRHRRCGSSAAHPRAGGEHRSRITWRTCPIGSSPRGRGTHLADDPEARIRIEREPRLVKETVRPCAARLAGGVEPDAGLANPDQKTPDARGQRHRRVGDPSAGLQHQTRESAHRNVGTHAVSVHDDEGAVQDVEASPSRGTGSTRDP